MAQFEGVRVPNQRRAACIQSVFHLSPFDEVALAVSEASKLETQIYVDRQADLWRWSLVHRGGGYPLLRISARFLEMDHRALMIGFRSVADGVCILSKDPEEPWEPEDWKVLEFDGPTEVEAVRHRLEKAFWLAD